MQALGEGPRQRCRMDYHKRKMLWITINVRCSVYAMREIVIILLCRPRFFEADPSPALRAAPFSKGARYLWLESLKQNNHVMSDIP